MRLKQSLSGHHDGTPYSGGLVERKTEPGVAYRPFTYGVPYGGIRVGCPGDIEASVSNSNRRLVDDNDGACAEERLCNPRGNSYFFKRLRGRVCLT